MTPSPASSSCEPPAKKVKEPSPRKKEKTQKENGLDNVTESAVREEKEKLPKKEKGKPCVVDIVIFSYLTQYYSRRRGGTGGRLRRGRKSST